MRKDIIYLLITIAAGVAGCGEKAVENKGVPAESSAPVGISAEQNEDSGPSGSATKAAVPQTLRTVRDHFMALPEKYFYAESCDKAKDKDCQTAKSDYLKTYLEVDDTKNGYLKAGCDGAQSCVEMTIFRKPDDSYMVAVVTEAEANRDQYFLEYQDGKWFEAGDRVIPEYGGDKFYELPRHGTTMSVFEKKVNEKGDDYEIAEKGRKLYDLVWKDGKFSKK